jgi:AcrR family transcriptional regulator
MLSTCGELGYLHTTTDEVIERAGITRTAFYAHFTGKEDCFIQAFGDLSEWVQARLAGVARRRPEPREALAAAFAEVLQMCANQPAYAKALIVEPLAAGGRVREEHDSLLDRLSEGLERVRGDVRASMAPPPSSASFTIGAIATSLRAKLIAGEADQVPGMLPELLYLVTVLHLGEEPAAGRTTAVEPLS